MISIVYPFAMCASSSKARPLSSKMQDPKYLKPPSHGQIDFWNSRVFNLKHIAESNAPPNKQHKHPKSKHMQTWKNAWGDMWCSAHQLSSTARNVGHNSFTKQSCGFVQLSSHECIWMHMQHMHAYDIIWSHCHKHLQHDDSCASLILEAKDSKAAKCDTFCVWLQLRHQW